MTENVRAALLLSVLNLSVSYWGKRNLSLLLVLLFLFPKVASLGDWLLHFSSPTLEGLQPFVPPFLLLFFSVGHFWDVIRHAGRQASFLGCWSYVADCRFRVWHCWFLLALVSRANWLAVQLWIMRDFYQFLLSRNLWLFFLHKCKTPDWDVLTCRTHSENFTLSVFTKNIPEGWWEKICFSVSDVFAVSLTVKISFNPFLMGPPCFADVFDCFAFLMFLW